MHRIPLASIAGLLGILVAGVLWRSLMNELIVLQLDSTLAFWTSLTVLFFAPAVVMYVLRDRL
jgi:hypothetical protein